MKNYLKHITLTLAMLLTFQVKSQESWDLKKCINYAIENNLEHHILLLDEETAKINALESKMNLLPSVSAGSEFTNSFGRSINESNDVIYSESFQIKPGVSSNLVLFNGFKQLNRISYFNYRKQASYWNTLKSQDDLAFSVMMAYYDIIYYRGLVTIAEEQLELSAYNLKKAEAEINIGTKSQADLSEIQANYELEKLTLVQAKNSLIEAEIKLNEFLNIPFDKLVQAEYDSNKFILEAAVSNNNDSTVYNFINEAPDLKSAEYELETAKKNLKIQRGSYLPSLELFAGIGSEIYATSIDSLNRRVIRDQFNGNMSKRVGLSLSIPIFQRYTNMANVQRAKINIENAQTTYDYKKLQLQYQLKNDIQKWNALEAEFNQLTKQVEANQLAYKAASRKYEEGLMSIIEMLTVKSRLATSQSQLLQTRLQWEIQYKLMEFYKGTRFWEN